MCYLSSIPVVPNHFCVSTFLQIKKYRNAKTPVFVETFEKHSKAASSESKLRNERAQSSNGDWVTQPAIRHESVRKTQHS